MYKKTLVTCIYAFDLHKLIMPQNTYASYRFILFSIGHDRNIATASALPPTSTGTVS